MFFDYSDFIRWFPFYDDDEKRYLDETKLFLSENFSCVYCGEKLNIDLSPCTCFKIKKTSPKYKMSYDNRDRLEELFSKEKERIKNRYRSEIRQEHEKAAEGSHNLKDINAILNLQKNKCYFCGKPIISDFSQFLEKGIIISHKFEKDHLKPISKGGSHWPHNIALACRPCNQLKHNRGEVAFWNLLTKKHGEKWVQKRKALADSNRKEKRELTKARKAVVEKRQG